MIKQARSIQDIHAVIQLLQEFLNETPYAQAPDAAQDREHLGKLAFTVLNHGYIWLATDQDQPIGLLMAACEPNMWIPRVQQLREIVWYVKPEYRLGLHSGRLFSAFTQKAQELLDADKIQLCFTTRMTTTDAYSLERRGFRLTEQTYLKER